MTAIAVGRFGIMAALALFFTSCGPEKHPLLRYESQIRSLEKPVSVTRAEIFLDLGSMGFKIEDARGQEISYSLQSVVAMDPTDNHMVSLGFLHIGTDDWQQRGSLVVPPNGSLENVLVEFMNDWVHERFPDGVPVPRPRLVGTVNDTAAASLMRGAVRQIETRRAVLQTVTQPRALVGDCDCSPFPEASAMLAADAVTAVFTGEVRAVGVYGRFRPDSTGASTMQREGLPGFNAIVYPDRVWKGDLRGPVMVTTTGVCRVDLRPGAHYLFFARESHASLDVGVCDGTCIMGSGEFHQRTTELGEPGSRLNPADWTVWQKDPEGGFREQYLDVSRP